MSRCCILLARLKLLQSDGTIKEVAPLGLPITAVGLSMSLDERSVIVTRPDTSGNDLFLVDGFR